MYGSVCGLSFDFADVGEVVGLCRTAEEGNHPTDRQNDEDGSAVANDGEVEGEEVDGVKREEEVSKEVKIVSVGGYDYHNYEAYNPADDG